MTTLFIPKLQKLGTSWWFWLILVVVIGFVIYSGLKKNREEKNQRKQREKEVKQLIKKTLAQNPQFKNVTISYEDVVSRSGKQYTKRDVFDVFIKITNAKKSQQKPIFKCFEVEGFADYADPKDKKSPVVVDWRINTEFNYEEHKTLLKHKPRSKLLIYFFALFKGRKRREYLKKHLEINQQFKTARRKIDLNTHQKQKTANDEVFKTQKPKSDDENL